MLADVGMPERDGYEVAAFIKGDPELAHIPVLLLTGAFEPIDEARARAVGCDGVLVKPFEPQMVISRVRDLLAGKREPRRQRQGRVRPPRRSHRLGRRLSRAASLEDYFDRLDAALASKGASTPTLDPVPAATAGPCRRPGRRSRPLRVGAEAPPSRAPLAEMDLTGWNPPRGVRAGGTPRADRERARPASGVCRPPAAPSVTGEPRELGPGLRRPARRRTGAAASAGSAAASSRQSREWTDVPESVIDAVVSKVIARMGDDTMRTAVLDAAERLVREEIDRIKNVR